MRCFHPTRPTNPLYFMRAVSEPLHGVQIASFAVWNGPSAADAPDRAGVDSPRALDKCRAETEWLAMRSEGVRGPERKPRIDRACIAWPAHDGRADAHSRRKWHDTFCFCSCVEC
eukprot:3610610-Pleurochrysis_carterae.AAC.2